MAIYRYKARSDAGKVLSGALEASSEQAVVRQLEEMGYTPISVKLEKASRKSQKRGIFGQMEKVKGKDLVMMTRQLHSLIHAGIPIMMALDVLEKQSQNQTLRGILTRVQEEISGGASLSDALRNFPGVFDDLYVNTVLAGETGGALPEVLGRLADLLESEQETRTAVKSAVRYPMIALTVLIIAFVVMSTMVVPKFAKIFTAIKMDLPLPTRMMIAMSNGMLHYYWILIPAVIAAIFAFIAYGRTKKGHYQIDRLKLKLPIFGPLFTKLAMFRFTKMLATLERSGVPILKIIEIVSMTVGNDIMAEQLLEMRKDIRDGKGISESIMARPVFPPMVSNMLSVGEETGRLDEMAESVAYYYEQEIRYTVATLTDLIEPVMTVFIAGFVLLFALAIFLPMWDMIKIAQR
ncbi:MAG TPA: type II secretion system F family protein [bacterium]|nr:type II secretion system F family protein [bacterium]HPJ71271.1 type II secretion system F family protein [bacterium]HPQ65096.1 type II secretion system F family protein [bacterium]